MLIGSHLSNIGERGDSLVVLRCSPGREAVGQKSNDCGTGRDELDSGT